ncbi:MAG: ANTAR domain-containing protein [Acidimicrobiia bacterium]|nr:ANTAR domain-containing protein [Acidimicrobiia bacterium]
MRTRRSPLIARPHRCGAPRQAHALLLGRSCGYPGPCVIETRTGVLGARSGAGGVRPDALGSEGASFGSTREAVPEPPLFHAPSKGCILVELVEWARAQDPGHRPLRCSPKKGGPRMEHAQVVERPSRASGSQAVAEPVWDLDQARHEIEHLRRALLTRALIGQAMGILMERYKITADEAFETLRTASQQVNIRLAELAQDLTQSGEWPPPQLDAANRHRSARAVSA